MKRLLATALLMLITALSFAYAAGAPHVRHQGAGIYIHKLDPLRVQVVSA